jgi:hypothetical protein
VKRVKDATVVVLGVCVAVRVGAALITPLIPALVVLVFVGGLLFWLVGKR